MKASDERDIEMARALEAGRAWQRENNKQQSKAALLLIPGMVVMFILLEYVPSPFDSIAMAIGAAISFTVFFFLETESLRSRRGSLIPAICLVAAMWLFAAITVVVSLIGRN